MSSTELARQNRSLDEDVLETVFGLAHRLLAAQAKASLTSCLAAASMALALAWSITPQSIRMSRADIDGVALHPGTNFAFRTE